jgi:cytochrome c553
MGRMKSFLIACLLSISIPPAAIGAPAAVMAADASGKASSMPAIAKADPVAGRAKSDSERCQECHLEDGNSIAPANPKLAGQSYDYLMKQLRDFQSRARRHQIMNAMVANIGDVDLSDIAAYFSSQEKMKGEGNEVDLHARNLFLNGDASRNILACISCHWVDGKGLHSGAASYPVIAGQHRFYLRGQLLDWRDGIRANSPSGVMNQIARLLSEDEIEALSKYISLCVPRYSIHLTLEAHS